jgi:hypothetical protein
MNGFFEAWPRGKGFQKFSRLRIDIGDPVIPPENISDPERQYAEVIAEVRGRIVEMWQQQQAELYGERPSHAAD